MIYTVLYRGPLESCHFNCWYCPFASKKASPEELEKDRRALDRFMAWIDRSPQSFNIFFTPKAEALTYDWYKQSFIHLSHKKKIKKVVIQTNLSCDTEWLSECNPDSSAFWLTYHPESVSENHFYNKCMVLYTLNLPFSVGVVGVKEHVDQIRHMRARLPKDVYLWINAYKRTKNYYSQKENELLSTIDPLFPLNQTYYRSRGKRCDTGDTVFSIDGDGTIRRCHFTDTILGNMSSHQLDDVSHSSPCDNETCHCHIGYTHLYDVKIKNYFGDCALERIPLMYQNTHQR